MLGKKPIRHKIKRMQAVTVIKYYFCIFSCGLISPLIGHRTINVPKIILRTHDFLSFTVIHSNFVDVLDDLRSNKKFREQV